MSGTHEAHPPKGPLERFLSRLSVKTAKLADEGGSGIPEYIGGEIAAAAAGMPDPIARNLPGVMLEEAPAVNRAVQELDLWGWQRWRVDCPQKNIRGELHGKLAAAVVADYQAGGKGYTLTEVRKYLGISGARFTQLYPHWYTLQRRMADAESALVQHLRESLRREVA